MSTDSMMGTILFKVPNSDDVLLVSWATSNNESSLGITLVPPVHPDGKYYPKMIVKLGANERTTMHGLGTLFCALGFEPIDDFEEHNRIIQGISLEKMVRQKIDECDWAGNNGS